MVNLNSVISAKDKWRDADKERKADNRNVHFYHGLEESQLYAPNIFSYLKHSSLYHNWEARLLYWHAKCTEVLLTLRWLGICAEPWPLFLPGPGCSQTGLCFRITWRSFKIIVLRGGAAQTNEISLWFNSS